MTLFSAKNRTKLINQLQEDVFDLLIIGGGITGAGIALDASSRGLKVALIEKNDFASGTSSKSTKLIHGGLRYLKQFDFWLVKEIGTERAVVHSLAPHLVVPEKMLLPLIENGSYGSWLTSIGLKIYDVLASVEGEDKRQMLDKEEALQMEPLLPKKILEGAGYYAEYRTDDARLTIEVLKTAVNNSAKALNYCEVEEFIYKDGKIIGTTVFDKIAQIDFNIKAKFIVNATGPWVDNLRGKNNPKEIEKKRLHLTKGVHLVFPYKKFPVRQSVYFDVPDGRMIFAIPRGKITYVGTTDTNYEDNLDEVKVRLVDALYLISAVNHMFPEIELSMSDIQSSWAGLRPLIHEEGKSAGELSRKDEIFESDSGLLSIAGGKLTGYRKMSERITDLICKKFKNEYGIEFNTVQTEELALSGSNFKNYEDVQKYIQQVYEKLKNNGFKIIDAEILVHKYGKHTDIILQKFYDFSGKDNDIRLAKAELWYCLHYEMTYTPLDFFIRRTGRLYFEIESIEKLKNPLLKQFVDFFDWDKETLKQHLNQLNKKIIQASHFE